MLQNAYLLAKIGADTAENERKFAENLPTIGNYPTGPLTGLQGSLHVQQLDVSIVPAKIPNSRICSRDLGILMVFVVAGGGCGCGGR